MKRFRLGDEEIEVDSLNLAHVLMSISQDRYNSSSSNNNNNRSSSSNSSSCDSFKILEQSCRMTVQDLRTTTTTTTPPLTTTSEQLHHSSTSSRMFKCKTCNRQFPSFQALGGHRASHKKPRMLAAEHCNEARVGPTKPRVHGCPICGLEFTVGQALGGHMRRHRAIADGVLEHQAVEEEKKLEEENTTLCLDLNLAPPGTQWQKIGNLGTQSVVHKVSSMVDCFL